MKPRRSIKASERQLGILAFEFRGTWDIAKRRAIAQKYAVVVDELIASKKWQDMPILENQLPDEWLPDAFFDYWDLGLPPERSVRKGESTSKPLSS